MGRFENRCVLTGFSLSAGHYSSCLPYLQSSLPHHSSTPVGSGLLQLCRVGVGRAPSYFSRSLQYYSSHPIERFDEQTSGSLKRTIPVLVNFDWILSFGGSLLLMPVISTVVPPSPLLHPRRIGAPPIMRIGCAPGGARIFSAELQYYSSLPTERFCRWTSGSRAGATRKLMHFDGILSFGGSLLLMPAIFTVVPPSPLLQFP